MNKDDLSSILADSIVAAMRGHISPDFELVLGSDRNREIDQEVKRIHRLRMTGSFALTCAGDGYIHASFKDGLLHCEDGPAWDEGWWYDRNKRVWSLNGKVLAVDNDDYRYLVSGNGEHVQVPRIDLTELGIKERAPSLGYYSPPRALLKLVVTG